jgi:hypothetical protein
MEDGVPTSNGLPMYSTIPYVKPEQRSVIELSDQGSESTMFYGSE